MSQIQNRSLVNLLGEGARVVNMVSLWRAENTAVTVITTEDVFTDLVLDSLAVLGAGSSAQWSLSDADTGEVTYNGTSPFVGNFVGAISIKSEGVAFQAQFRVIKNAGQIGGRMEQQAGSNASRGCPLVVSMSLIAGDTIRVQVMNIDSMIDLTVKSFQFAIS